MAVTNYIVSEVYFARLNGERLNQLINKFKMVSEHISNLGQFHCVRPVHQLLQ